MIIIYGPNGKPVKTIETTGFKDKLIKTGGGWLNSHPVENPNADDKATALASKRAPDQGDHRPKEPR